MTMMMATEDLDIVYAAVKIALAREANWCEDNQTKRDFGIETERILEALDVAGFKIARIPQVKLVNDVKQPAAKKIKLASAKTCCCCGDYAMDNGYCGPSGCTNRPA